MTLRSQTVAQGRSALPTNNCQFWNPAVACRRHLLCPFLQRFSSQRCLPVTFSSSKARAEQRQSSRRDVEGWIQPCWRWGTPNTLTICKLLLFGYSSSITSHSTSLMYARYCHSLQQEVGHAGTQLLPLLAGAGSAVSPGSLNVFIDCPSL